MGQGEAEGEVEGGVEGEAEGEVEGGVEGGLEGGASWSGCDAHEWGVQDRYELKECGPELEHREWVALYAMAHERDIVAHEHPRVRHVAHDVERDQSRLSNVHDTDHPR